MQNSKFSFWLLLSRLLGPTLIFSLAASTHAQIVRFESILPPVETGVVFELTVIGDDFTSSPDGGGLNVSFNPEHLRVHSVSIDPVWTAQGIGLSTGTIDNVTGTIEGITFNSFSNVGNTFPIIFISLESISTGKSNLSLSNNAMNPWASNGLLVQPEYQTTQISSVSSTNIPIPFWSNLFLAAALIFTERRRQRNRYKKNN